MKITIIGLGLIGGSMAKAIKNNTDYIITGIDKDKEVLEKALEDGVIDEIGNAESLKNTDLSFICLHPQKTINYISDNLNKFKKGSIVADVSGVKEAIAKAVEKPLLDNGLYYVGTHPMAGREFSGYKYAVDDLFAGASFIIIKTENTDTKKIKILEEIAKDTGFGDVVVTTANEHDKVIAYTSQLAHIVSNAYVKSPELIKERGFSAGSFLDLTRVAKLNEDMWSELFIMNRENLLFEVDNIIKNLEEYKQALQNEDIDYMHKLLKDGRILKEKSLIKK